MLRKWNIHHLHRIPSAWLVLIESSLRINHGLDQICLYNYFIKWFIYLLLSRKNTVSKRSYLRLVKRVKYGKPVIWYYTSNKRFLFFWNIKERRSTGTSTVNFGAINTFMPYVRYQPVGARHHTVYNRFLLAVYSLFIQSPNDLEARWRHSALPRQRPNQADDGKIKGKQPANRKQP